MKSQAAVVAALVVVALFSSCRYEPPAEKRTDATANATTTATDTATEAAAPETRAALPALPPGHPAIGQLPATGTPSAPSPVPTANLLRGEVVETMDAGGYTYMRLRGARGELWVAVRQAKVAKGDIVTVAAEMTMKEFESKSLDRKFDMIVFGTLAPATAVAPTSVPLAASAPASMPLDHPMPGNVATMGGGMGGGASKIEPGEIKVAKAEGADGRTVAEIWGSKDSMKGRQVVVRGKVVKFLPEIMGKNWIHLQDGSGSPDARTNDITLTTIDKAVAGDIVLVTGIVRTDVNLGAGYTYPVIIEDAKLKKQP